MASRPDRPASTGAPSVVVDTSAAVAALLGEDTAPAIRRALGGAEARSMSAPSVVELGMVLQGRIGDDAPRTLGRFLRDAEVEVVPFDERLAMLAIDGFRRYGKGRHAAALNLGDCFTYALAAARGEPVLCTGDDFRRTSLDIVDLDR
jgi:ribonuclease VapC